MSVGDGIKLQLREMKRNEFLLQIFFVKRCCTYRVCISASLFKKLSMTFVTGSLEMLYDDKYDVIINITVNTDKDKSDISTWSC